MKKIKSSAIYYALFLSMVMGILLSSMTLLSGLNRQLVSSFEVENRLVDNAYSGCEYALANYTELPERQPVTMRLFGEGIDSVRLIRKNWGAFTVLESTSMHQGKSFTKIALAGLENQPDQPNLVVCDLDRPIALCGDVRLEGKAFLPKSGLKRAYIEGKNFTGGELYYGTYEPSNRNLPPVQQQFLESFTPGSAVTREWHPDVDSLKVSFSENPVHLFSEDFIYLENISADGHVFIESADSIWVSASAQLDKVILKSPVILFESGFQGNVQAIAEKLIHLQPNVLLKYPSVLGLIEEEEKSGEQNARIQLDAQSQVIGSVFLINQKEDFRHPVQLILAPESRMDGFAYCTGETQLQGTINGHLYTGKFFLETQAASYENHILDGKILNQLPPEFIYINLLKTTDKLTRIEWLR